MILLVVDIEKRNGVEYVAKGASVCDQFDSIQGRINAIFSHKPFDVFFDRVSAFVEMIVLFQRIYVSSFIAEKPQISMERIQFIQINAEEEQLIFESALFWSQSAVSD